MNKEEHKKRHVMLHHCLDELLADFVKHKNEPVLRLPIQELLDFSYQQTQNPTE